MKRSLGRTLAIRFAATMAVGLAGVAAAAFWGTSRIVQFQLDQALAAGAFLLEAGLGGAAGHPGGEPLFAADPSAHARDVNRYVALRAGDGRVLWASPPSASGLPLDRAALETARQGRRVWVSGRWGREPVRSLYYPVARRGAGGDRVLQVAASLRPLRVVQRDLVLALLAVMVLGSGATLVGAWRLAGSAVQPVAVITEQATRIEAGTLDQRISAHADTEEYQGLVAVLNRMLERLEMAFRAQRRLTADVSHELRTPLTALRGEMEVALRAERSPREYQRVLRSALEEIDRLTAMSEDLLLITRAEANLLRPQRVPTDVNAIVRQALTTLRGRIEEKGLTVQERLDSVVHAVALDPDLGVKLFGQLLENAVKFAPVEGRLAVASEPFDGGVRVTVEDSGPGIAPADLPHVFEPFYRADPARSRGTGTGLGLALAAAIVRLHGGDIRASAAPGGGARFQVELPVHHHT